MSTLQKQIFSLIQVFLVSSSFLSRFFNILGKSFEMLGLPCALLVSDCSTDSGMDRKDPNPELWDETFERDELKTEALSASDRDLNEP